MITAVRLQADCVSYGYDPLSPIITEFDGRFDAGEVVAITGPSGRGKSTLLYIMGLMLRPEVGHVLIDGNRVSDWPDSDRAYLRASHFGFVFQDAALDPTRTVLDNVIETSLYRGANRDESSREAMALLRRFDVSLRANAKPGQISGGQAQRIALCRALIGSPSIVLADEPTGNLDSVTSSAVITALRHQAHLGSSVVIVTHDTEVVLQCDRVVKL